jgi:hypothetical protein
MSRLCADCKTNHAIGDLRQSCWNAWLSYYFSPQYPANGYPSLPRKGFWSTLWTIMHGLNILDVAFFALRYAVR